MIRIIYYTWRNLWYYRRTRNIAHTHLMDMTIHDNDARRALTDACLATVGLKTVNDKKNTVPWYILLSTTQRSWIRVVSKYNYKVGLT